MTYKFEIAGQEYEVPLFADLPIGAIRKARTAKDDMDKAFVILEQALGEDSAALAAVDTLTGVEFGKWLEGWTQGASLGEPSGSAN